MAKATKQSEWTDITIDTDTVRIVVEWDDFCMIDKRDIDQNGTRAVPLPRTHKSAVARMRKWATHTAQNVERLAGRTFWEIRNELGMCRIALHTFCAID